MWPETSTSIMAVLYWETKLGGRFGYFLFFLCSGRGKGESEAKEEKGSVLIENPRRGGGFPGGARGGQEGVCGELGTFWGGGRLNIFFSAPKCPPSKSSYRYPAGEHSFQ